MTIEVILKPKEKIQRADGIELGKRK